MLTNKKSPSRKVGETDNRESHFYLALYWAEELRMQNDDLNLKHEFKNIYNKLSKNEKRIINEIKVCQGQKINLGGYYKTNNELTEKVMRPSKTLNNIIKNI